MKRGELLTNDLVSVKLANGKTIEGRVALMYYDGTDEIGLIVLNENLTEVHPIENVTKLVTCYFNEVQVVEEPFEIAANAPYINLPINTAVDICDNLLEANVIHSFCIPQLNSSKVILHTSKAVISKTIFVDLRNAIIDKFVSLEKLDESNETTELIEEIILSVDGIEVDWENEN